MPKHKKQHVIPNSYLKSWCDINTPPNQDPYIWIFDKESHQAKNKAPANSFCENDFYTVHKDGGKDLYIEAQFSKIEKYFAETRKNKLLVHEKITADEHIKLCYFLASLHARTPSRINFMVKQFQPLLIKMEQMAVVEENAIENEKKMFKLGVSIATSDNTISHEELREVVNNPIEHIMIESINAEAAGLAKLDFCVFFTKTTNVFITSDNPCVWYDSESHLRAPMYQSPALQYDSINIILPISPTHCIFLNKKGLKGYVDIDINPESIQKINQIVYEHCEKKYISNSEIIHQVFKNG